jgi:hypothetical protein
MKKVIIALIASVFTSFIFAQDTATVSHNIDSVKAAAGKSTRAKQYLLYNYTSLSNDNAIYQGFRSDASNRFVITGDFSSNSKTIPSAFGFKLLFNSPINQNLVDRADKFLGKQVNFDENTNTGIAYEHYLKHADMTLVLGYNYRQMLNLSGPKEAFETIFYGNARFEGDTANLSHIHFDFYTYNQYSIGLIKQIDYGNYQMQVGMIGSFLQVINNTDISTGNTTLYTAPYGEYLDINYDLTFNQATPNAPKFGDLNGVGASGDFHLAFANKDKWKLTFDVKDLGIVTFRKTPVNYTGTNNVMFQGFVIPDLLHFSSATFDTINLDSALTSKLPSKTNNQYSIFLPFSVNLAFSKPFLNDRLVMTLGVQYHYLPNYKLYGYAKFNYFLKPDMVVSASVAGGGYSLFDLGAEFCKSWKYFDVAVGTTKLIGMVVPTLYSGSNLYIRLGVTF